MFRRGIATCVKTDSKEEISKVQVRFAWVCRNIKFNVIERVELTDAMLLDESYPSWITRDNCEILGKILPTGVRDKSGREAYHKDVSEDKNGQRYIVEWHEQGASFYLSPIIPEGQMPSAGHPILMMMALPEHTIIGNAIENPGLLETTS